MLQERVEAITPVSLTRHVLCLVLFYPAWIFLSRWYQFQHLADYCIFVFLYAMILLMGIVPFIFPLLTRTRPSRILAGAVLIFFMLPWGEWFQLNVISSREQWSQQLLGQLLFVYASFLLLSVLPGLTTVLRETTIRITERVSQNSVSLWIPCFLFFGFCSAIAFFVFQCTPKVQDSAAYLFQANVFSKFKLYAPAPPVPACFDTQGDMLVIHNGKWFSMYPPGFSALLTPFVMLHLEWFMAPLFGALTVAIWTAHISRWYGRRLAVIFSWLFIFSPFTLLMFSAPMVHVPELFLASAILYVCRSVTEKGSRISSSLLCILLVVGVLVRSFSLLAFLFPVLVFTSIRTLRSRMLAPTLCMMIGVVLGFAILDWYQWKTTDNPTLSGYRLEYPDYRYGFGKSVAGTVHSPQRGLENTSNNLLGLNQHLSGWYGGSFIFLLFFLFSEPKFQIWDKLFILSCVCLIGFYYFFVAQDLVLGPRFFFLLSPVLLVLISRTSGIRMSVGATDTTKMISGLFVISAVTFPLFGLFPFLQMYRADPTLRSLIAKKGSEKTVVLLDTAQRTKVNWNDPFLSRPVILCLDLPARKQDLLKSLPGYHPVYFHTELQNVNGKLSVTSRFHNEPRSTPAGYFSFFELATALQQASGDSSQDCFDVAYQTVFDSQADAQLQYVQNYQPEKRHFRYQSEFELGLLGISRILLWPKAAFQREGEKWAQNFEVAGWRGELFESMDHFHSAGETGRIMIEALHKVSQRIDKDSNQELSDLEIKNFLGRKLRGLSGF